MLCPSCATQNDEGGAFCVGCGAALAPSAWSSPTASAPPPSAAPPPAWNAPPPPTEWNQAAGAATPASAPGMPPSSWQTASGSFSQAHDHASSDTTPVTDMSVVDTLLLPLQDPEAAPRLGVGALFALVPILGHIWLMGYVVQWTRRLMRGESRRLPEWTDLGGMFVEGMWASVIACVFSFVPVALTGFLAIPKIMHYMSLASRGEHIDPFAVIFSIVGYMLLGLFLLILCSIPVPLVICHYAGTGDFVGAMSPGTWGPLIMQAPLDYGGCWLAAILAAMVGSTAVSLLNIVPIIGTLACFVAGLALGVVLMLATQAIFTRYWLRHAGRALGG